MSEINPSQKRSPVWTLIVAGRDDQIIGWVTSDSRMLIGGPRMDAREVKVVTDETACEWCMDGGWVEDYDRPEDDDTLKPCEHCVRGENLRLRTIIACYVGLHGTSNLPEDLREMASACAVRMVGGKAVVGDG